MKKILILILSILLITGCSAIDNNDVIEDENKEEVQNEQSQESKEPVMAPGFELMSMDDSLIKLSDMKDKNVLLNFWYTGCSFCVIEMPDLQKLQDTYKDDLLLLAINVGENKEEIQEFMDENKLSFTVLLDEDMNVANTYGIRSYPTTIAVNKKGEVIGGYIGMLTYEQMEQLYSFFE
ncbi:MAG: TlpA family protein disulfide reductase [Tissierellia bacterium]|nr:TlpA family protein disulfide reductase [Tissierellia bacterium]HKM00555.1 TlpA disulfide reductase family protein [Sedimentibacter sp.]